MQKARRHIGIHLNCPSDRCGSGFAHLRSRNPAHPAEFRLTDGVAVSLTCVRATPHIPPSFDQRGLHGHGILKEYQCSDWL